MTAATTIDSEAIHQLGERLRGALIEPGDLGYDEARSVWNGLIDRRPALIARCAGAADVIDAVDFAREHDLLLSVRGGGHNVAGSAVNDDGLVIDLSAMRGVHVDPASRHVRVEGGATWADLDRETQVFGLAVPGGVVSTTGVAGLTLHGGVGHLRRKHGLSIDNLVSVDLVTADGRLVRASADENAELFWAVRGAGSNFGVVTSFEFRAHPVGPTVTVGAVFYPFEHASRLLAAWRDFMAAAPEDVSSLALCWSIPEHPGFPSELHGTPVVAIAAVHTGELDDGAAIIEPLRKLGEPLLDLSGPWPWVALQSAFDPVFPNGHLRYWKSRALAALSGAAIDDIVAFAARRPADLSAITIWHHGGAMSRVADADTAYADRSAPFLVTAEATWTDAALTDTAIAWAKQTWDGMGLHSTGGVYLNFPGLGEDNDALARAGYGSNHDRLAALKRRYDPHNLFRSNVNITPAGPAAA